MRTPTFATKEEVEEEYAPAPARHAHTRVVAKGSQRPAVALPKKPAHLKRGASPWFALVSGMVVASAVVMMLLAVAPESLVPQGTVAHVLERAMTATVIFSR
jgi:hypothetical protein